MNKDNIIMRLAEISAMTEKESGRHIIVKAIKSLMADIEADKV